MGNLHDLLLLVVLGAVIASWLKLSRAREIAVEEARRHCERNGLQLLDETVGLRALRLRRGKRGRMLERGYGFEVSVDGDDRESGRLWMNGRRVTELVLPTSHWLLGATMPPPQDPGSESNVVPFRPRIERPDRPRRLH
jgi:hypothetical protein